MKKLIIFFIIMVLVTTLSMTKKTKKIEGRELTEQEIEEYRNSLIEGYKMHNIKYTEQALESQVNRYKSEQEKEKIIKGVSFAEAFPKGLKISAIVCVVVAFIFFIKGSYYNELLNSHLWRQGREISREGRIEINNVKAKRNFWGRWFQ